MSSMSDNSDGAYILREPPDTCQRDNAFTVSDAQLVSPTIVNPGRSLESLVPVLKRLKNSLVVEADEFHFVGDVPDSEWKDLQNYTRFFTAASIRTDEGPKVPEATCFRLGQLQGATKTLFPSLVYLNFTNLSPGSSLFHLPFLFSPSLRNLIVVNIGATFAYTVAAFLNRLGKEGALEHLLLDTFHLTSHIMTSIGHCRHLKTLHLKNLEISLDRPVLTILGILSDLHDLSITVSDELDYVQSFSPPSSDPSLRSLKLSALKNLQLLGGPSMIQDILDGVLVSQNLETLLIRFTGYRYNLPPEERIHPRSKMKPKRPRTTPEAYLNQAFGDMVTNIVHQLASTLKSLTLGFDTTDRENVRPPCGLITLLSNLQNLETLDLSGTLLPIEDLDFDLHRLDGLWPKVQHLRLPLVSKSDLSLSTLTVIAKSCPHLKSLECLINLSAGCLAFSAPPAIMASHPLQTLSIGSSVSTMPMSLGKCHVANLLCALFPDLVDIKTHPLLAPRIWGEVFELVQMCQKARDYDRVREAQRQDGQ